MLDIIDTEIELTIAIFKVLVGETDDEHYRNLQESDRSMHRILYLGRGQPNLKEGR